MRKLNLYKLVNAVTFSDSRNDSLVFMSRSDSNPCDFTYGNE